MKLFFLRGFNTNSSSSHSIVIKKDAEKIFARPAGDDYYGWDYFILKSSKEKADYLAAAVPNMWKRARKISDILKRYPEESDKTVDHQSYIGIDRSDKELIAFLKALFEYIVTNDKVLVLGGNDNSDTEATYREMIGSYDYSFRELFKTIERAEGKIFVKKESDNRYVLSAKVWDEPVTVFVELL